MRTPGKGPWSAPARARHPWCTPAMVDPDHVHPWQRTMVHPWPELATHAHPCACAPLAMPCPIHAHPCHGAPLAMRTHGARDHGASTSSAHAEPMAQRTMARCTPHPWHTRPRDKHELGTIPCTPLRMRTPCQSSGFGPWPEHELPSTHGERSARDTSSAPHALASGRLASQPNRRPGHGLVRIRPA